MRIRIIRVVAFIVFICLAIFGYSYRSSYTDISQNANYLDSLSVAELSANWAEAACAQMAEDLPDAKIILRVKATEDIENLFQICRQKVCVQQVFTGEEISVGTEMYLISSRWKLILNKRHQGIERGFVNVMKVGNEYLVFLTEQVEENYNDIPVYRLYDETVITPIFCYKNINNVIVPTTGDSTYVPYIQVRDNEFFAKSDDALQIWSSFKELMLKKYPVT